MPDGTKGTEKAKRSLVVQGFTNSVLDPKEQMLGPVENGGTIIANTAPGCWGPMITPSLRGGHEVTQPVYIEGAIPGDGVVIRIRDITCSPFSNDELIADLVYQVLFSETRAISTPSGASAIKSEVSPSPAWSKI